MNAFVSLGFLDFEFFLFRISKFEFRIYPPYPPLAVVERLRM
jgi:hypothetical protein